MSQDIEMCTPEMVTHMHNVMLRAICDEPRKYSHADVMNAALYLMVEAGLDAGAPASKLEVDITETLGRVIEDVIRQRGQLAKPATSLHLN